MVLSCAAAASALVLRSSSSSSTASTTSSQTAGHCWTYARLQVGSAFQGLGVRVHAVCKYMSVVTDRVASAVKQHWHGLQLTAGWHGLMHCSIRPASLLQASALGHASHANMFSVPDLTFSHVLSCAALWYVVCIHQVAGCRLLPRACPWAASFWAWI
jgi:hypothetical protein